MKAEERMRSRFGELLEEGEVEIVLGYGRRPSGRIGPELVESPGEVDRLIWNPLCEVNLARYLRDLTDKRVGVILKGCDSRAVVELLKANQLKRKNLFILGAPCRGIVDIREFPIPPEDAQWEKDGIILHLNGELRRFKREEISFEACRSCRYPNPVIYDELIGEPVEVDRSRNPYKEIEEIEELSSEERWELFKREFERCIRCYACRNACPLCFCEECFVEAVQPRWVGKGTEVKENITFHLIRMMHLAGRCVGCGACERACPMDIRLHLLTRKIEKIADEMFGYAAGLSLDEPDLLTTFSQDDPEDFIL